MKRVISIILALTVILSAMPIFNVFADASAVTVVADEGWKNATYDSSTGELADVDNGYSLLLTLNSPSAGKATVGKYNSMVISANTVVIPSKVTYNGTTYSVTNTATQLLNGNDTTKKLVISEGVETIGTQSFRYSNITEVSFPSTLKVIGHDSFYQCTGLTDVVVPEGVTSVGANGYGAFANCTGLKSLTLPSTITTSLGAGAFMGCSSLSTININYNLNEITYRMFRGCGALTSFEIPSAVTTIGAEAFRWTGLKKITIPEKITSIASDAFNSSKITEITFEPSTAPTLGTNAFAGVSGLTVKYPASGTGYTDAAWQAYFPAGTVFELQSNGPIASGISISGNNLVGSTLQGSYSTYTDPTGNSESGSSATWRRASDKAFTTNVETIKTVAISAGTVAEYTLTQADAGKYISFSVTPRSSAQTDNVGEEITAVLSSIIRIPQTVPTVTLVSPYDDYREYVNTGIEMNATAVCDNTTITKIEYYANNTKVAESTTAPFKATWTPAQAGVYEVYAKAYNALGEAGSSASVSMRVYDTNEVMDSVWAEKWNYDFNEFTADKYPDVYTSAIALPGTNPPVIEYNVGGTYQSAAGVYGRAANDSHLQLNSATGWSEVPYLGTPLTALDEPVTNVVAEMDIAFSTTDERRYPFTYRTPRGAYFAMTFTVDGKIGYCKTAYNDVAIFKDENGNDLTYAAETWYRVGIKFDLENKLITYYLNGNEIGSVVPHDAEYFTAITDIRYRGAHINGTQFGKTYIDNLMLGQEQDSYVSSTITLPENSTYHLTGDAIRFQGYAKDSRGKAIANTVIYANGQEIATKTGDSYDFTYSELEPGYYDIYTKSTSEDGMVGVSNTVKIIVSGAFYPHMYDDNMLLQRNKEINLSGTGVDGTVVTAELNGVTASATVTGGKWNITIPPQPAVKQTTLKFSTNDGVSVTYNNVAIGELILCSGQSNMAHTVESFASLKSEADKDYPDIRLFKQDLTKATAPQTDIVSGYWDVATVKNSLSFSATGYLVGKNLYNSLGGDVPVGLVYAAVGGTSINMWVTPTSFDYDPDLKMLKQGNTHYNSMVAPWTTFTFGNVVWYQGEQDTYSSRNYEKELTAYIQGYREIWNDDTLNFVIVQLPPYAYVNNLGPHRLMTNIRDAQWNVSERLDRVATVVTLDLGNANDIHPSNKVPLAQRCVLAIRHFMNPDDTSIVWKSPSYDRHEQNGNTMTIYFKDCADGLKTTDGQAPRGFKIAGDDGVFTDVSVTLSGNTILVDTSSVSGTPKVRYAWEDVPVQDGINSRVNFVNSAGLLVAPFRTDNDVYRFNYNTSTGTSTPVNYTPMIVGIKAGQVIDGTAVITVTASDNDSEVAKVEVYGDGVLLGQATQVAGTEYYEFSWTGATAGTHTFYAIATDVNGAASTKSDPSIGSTTVTPRSYTLTLTEGEAPSAFIFTDLSGADIDKLVIANGVKATAKETGMLVLAVYNGDVLLTVKMANNEALSFTAKELEGATEVKAMLWDGLSTIRPLAKPDSVFTE